MLGQTFYNSLFNKIYLKQYSSAHKYGCCCILLWIYNRPDKHDRVVVVPCKGDASLRYCTEAYTGQVTFYMIPETHGYV